MANAITLWIDFLTGKEYKYYFELFYKYLTCSLEILHRC